MRENGAFKKDVIEIMVYMWLTETKGGILLYENKDSNEYSIFYVDFYIPIINSIKKKCLALYMVLKFPTRHDPHIQYVTTDSHGLTQAYNQGSTQVFTHTFI
jgi:hypothetical protein